MDKYKIIRQEITNVHHFKLSLGVSWYATSRGKPQSEVKTLLSAWWRKKIGIIGWCRSLEMPGPSIESVNSLSAWNVGDLSQEGDFVKGTKITAFVFLMLLCMLGNALLTAVVYKNANRRMRTPNNYFILNIIQGHPMDLFLKISVLLANFCWLGDVEK